jgi:hypothetical protein
MDNINKDSNNLKNVNDLMNQVQNITNKSSQDLKDINDLIKKILEYLNFVEKYKSLIFYYFGFLLVISLISIYVNSVLLKNVSIIFMIIYIVIVLIGLVGIYFGWSMLNKKKINGDNAGNDSIVDIF